MSFTSSSVSQTISKPKIISYEASFSPEIATKKRVVIPVSMGRYHLSAKKTKEYDEMLSSLFADMANRLQNGEIEGVDVISTCQLQGINWDEKTVRETEEHFLKTHHKLLTQQSHCYKWQDWINAHGPELYESYYGLVFNQSQKGTEWYELMLKTYENVKLESTSLENSLEYQRREYAAIMLMQPYDYLVYTGYISLAWSYLYHKFPDRKLPVFTRVEFSKQKKVNSSVTQSDATHTSRMILSMIEQTLTSSNFPEDEKQKIIDKGMSLFYAYEPRKKVKLTICG